MDFLDGPYKEWSDTRKLTAYAQETLGKVREWKWATGNMDDLEPFSEELNGKEKFLEEGQANPDEHYRHGYDSAGQLVAVIQKTCHYFYGRGEQSLREIVAHKNGKTFSLYYCYEYAFAESMPGAPLQRSMFRDRFHFRDTVYVYENGRLSHSLCGNFEIEEEMGKIGLNARTPWYVRQDYCYDSQGLDTVSSGYVEADGSPSVDDRKRTLVYRRPRKGETVKKSEEQVAKLFKPALLEALAGVPHEGPYEALFLWYNSEDYASLWPPLLLLVSASYREYLRQSGKNVDEFLWSPEEACLYAGNRQISLESAELEEACKLHALLMESKGSFASLKNLLHATATRLNQEKIPGLPVIETFVVVALDGNGSVKTETAFQKSGAMFTPAYRA